MADVAGFKLLYIHRHEQVGVQILQCETAGLLHAFGSIVLAVGRNTKPVRIAVSRYGFKISYIQKNTLRLREATEYYLKVYKKT